MPAADGRSAPSNCKPSCRTSPAERADQFLKPLNDAMKEFEINTPKRQAAFLAQIAHESGELKYMEEIASGEAYEGRKSLGNTAARRRQALQGPWADPVDGPEQLPQGRGGAEARPRR